MSKRRVFLNEPSCSLTHGGYLTTNITHKTKNIVIKNANVDIGIIPIINWLNSFDSVVTYYSCQGTDKLEERPYVLFTCTKILDLITVLPVLDLNGETRIKWSSLTSRFEYITRFHDEEGLKTTIDYLERYGHANV